MNIVLLSIIAYREIGKHLRNESRFDEAMIEVLNNLKVAGQKVLFVVNDANVNARKSAANIQRTNVVNVNELNTYTIMNANVVVLTEASAASF